MFILSIFGTKQSLSSLAVRFCHIYKNKQVSLILLPRLCNLFLLSWIAYIWILLFQERAPVRFDEVISELVPSNGLNAVSVSNSRRQSLRSSERLADGGTSELGSSYGLSADGVSSSSRQRLRANERLPGAVLLARARLVERLRGMSVSANRLPRALCKFETLRVCISCPCIMYSIITGQIARTSKL